MQMAYFETAPKLVRMVYTESKRGFESLCAHDLFSVDTGSLCPGATFLNLTYEPLTVAIRRRISMFEGLAARVRSPECRTSRSSFPRRRSGALRMFRFQGCRCGVLEFAGWEKKVVGDTSFFSGSFRLGTRFITREYFGMGRSRSCRGCGHAPL